MSRKINPLCLDCSRLSQQDAIALHGTGTKTPCWNARTCPRRRSHYRHRLENNAKQRGGYRAAKTEGQAVEMSEGIFVPVHAPPVALLYLFRENRQDAHLHAIAGAVWQGNQKLVEVAPVHCMGMTNRQVNEYLRNVLEVVGEKFGITEFEPPIRMEPMECQQFQIQNFRSMKPLIYRSNQASLRGLDRLKRRKSVLNLELLMECPLQDCPLKVATVR